MKKWFALLALLLASVTKAQTITQQPVNQAVSPGQTATFTITISDPTCSVMWQRNGSNIISGVDRVSYTTPPAVLSDNGTKFGAAVYNCKTAANAHAVPAVLTVVVATAPVITAQPANQTALFGQPATFFVVASGTTPLGYQWSENGAAITGATSASYTTPAVSEADNSAVFSVVITNSVGAVTSANAVLTVTPVDQSITITPPNAVIGTTQMQSFTATATYSDGSTQDVTALATWTSDAPAVAVISAPGVVTGVSVGTANIRATLGSITGTTAVTVNLLITINSGSTAVYDDGTAILPGSIAIAQQQDATNSFGIGTITSDSSGNLSGSFALNPNWVDANGNLNFIFGLPIAPNIFTYPVSVGEFQHGSTGLTINLVMFKQGALAIKSQTLAVTP